MTGPRMTLWYDMRAPASGSPPGDLYRAAVEQSAWVDSRGFSGVTLTEHHDTEDGYLPSPIVLGAAIAGATDALILQLMVLLLPLYDPLRLAEDLAVLDLVSGSRIRLTFGLGYRREEYRQLSADWGGRGHAIEEGVQTLKDAWSGQPFEYRGRTVQILPRPGRQPRPEIFLGGDSSISGTRAARIADGYHPTSIAAYDHYLAECERLGVQASVASGVNPIAGFLYVAEDPEQFWSQIEPYVMYDNNAYATWNGASSGHFSRAADPGELRRRQTYRVVTPAECVTIAETEDELIFKPLAGGMHPDLGWQSLQLFTDTVIPELQRRKVIDHAN